MKDTDIIIPWVDGSDSAWLAEKRRFESQYADSQDVTETGGGENFSEIRYRYWGTLRYILRGIERFCPWVRRVHLVTWGHVPEWLNLDNQQLNVVRHGDFIPAEYLPTFSSRAIELNAHRISGLAEKFILFNDDMFVLRPLPETRFFRLGMPCDMARLSLIARSSISHTVLNMVEILNRRHSKNLVMRRNSGKWFSPRYGLSNLLKTIDLSVWREFAGLTDTHMPQPYRREIFEKMWAEEGEILDATCRQKFRSPMGVNHWLMRYEQLAQGRFEPISMRDTRLDFLAESRIGEIENYIREQKYALICLNDSTLAGGNAEFESLQKRLVAALEEILPEKSSYEK